MFVFSSRILLSYQRPETVKCLNCNTDYFIQHLVHSYFPLSGPQCQNEFSCKLHWEQPSKQDNHTRSICMAVHKKLWNPLQNLSEIARSKVGGEKLALPLTQIKRITSVWLCLTNSFSHSFIYVMCISLSSNHLWLNMCVPKTTFTYLHMKTSHTGIYFFKK